MGDGEVPLSGGRSTPGVVRVSDTVRRPPAPNAPFAHGLLRHLEGAGFDGAPRFLGRDARGRDVLGWIPGDVPADLSPGHGDRTLRRAARLIRAFHDAGSGYAAGAGEVACHNDLSPCNFVFRGGTPVAIVDFDAAAPGSRAHDLGYAAWLWLDLGAPDLAAAEQSRRLGAFLGAYGPAVTRDAVLAAMLTRQDMQAARGREVGDPAMEAWARACRGWVRGNLDALRG